jgi:hypothetical protein
MHVVGVQDNDVLAPRRRCNGRVSQGAAHKGEHHNDHKQHGKKPVRFLHSYPPVNFLIPLGIDVYILTYTGVFVTEILPDFACVFL